MKKGLFLVLGLSVLLTTAHAAQADDCNRYYQSAVKFIVDTPTVHPFTVSESGRQVTFSAGNLQYCPARDEWRFALRQFDRVGNGKSVYAPEGLKTAGTNVNDNVTTVFYDSIDYSTPDLSTPSKFKEIKGVPCNNLLVSKKYGGWIDVFAWGTSGHGRRVGDSLAMFFNPYDFSDAKINNEHNVYAFGPSFDAGHGPEATTNDIDSKSGSNQYFDWGYNNVIREYHGSEYDANNALWQSSKGTTMYMPKVWRTLTADEWTYLLTERMVEGKQNAFTYVRLQYGKNNSDTVTGVLIYPDDFSFSEAGVATLPFGANNAVSNIDASVWGLLEEAGVVFLPSEQQRYVSNGAPSITYATEYGLSCAYWSASAANAENAHNVWFNIRQRGLTPKNSDPRYIAYPVRLVQDMMVRRYYASITSECEYEWDLGVKKVPITQNKAGVKLYYDTLHTVDGEDSLYCILSLKKELPVYEIKDTTYSISNYTFILGDYTKSWSLEETGHAYDATKIYDMVVSDGDCDTAIYILTLTRKLVAFTAYNGRRITFSPGNLQYRASPTTWRFAQRQFDRCGAGGNETTVYWDDNGVQTKCDNNKIAWNYSGWIDLFGWGTGGQGHKNTTNNTYSNWTDWGSNVISGYPAKTWVTPVPETYLALLINKADSYSFVRVHFSEATTDTVTGLLIYPNGFTWEKAGVTPLSVGASAGVQPINAATWGALENAGCAFLPSSNTRSGALVYASNYGSTGSYWLWEANETTTAYRLYINFSGKSVNHYNSNLRRYGCSVRLIRYL